LLCIPAICQGYKKRLFLNWRLFCWGVCFLLAIFLFFQQRPTLPYFTPSSANVIDFRSFIIHFAVAACVAFAVIQIPLSRIIKGAHIFYTLTAVGAGILCYLALSAFPFFRLHYPFNTPASISFPFPSQNMAAMFMSLCFMGSIGIALTKGLKTLLFIAAPIFLFAAALTGSRSNLFICFVLMLFYIVIYNGFYSYFPIISLIQPASVLLAFLIGIFVIVLFSDWQPIARSTSIFWSLWKSSGNIFLGGEEGSPRSELISKALNLSGSAVSAGDEKNFPFGPYTFALGLTSLTEGCRNMTNNIPDLKPGRPYHVRLTITHRNSAEYSADLNVFELTDRKQNMGSMAIEFHSPQKLSKVFYFLADTDTSYIDLNASLSGFRTQMGNVKYSDCLKSRSLFSFQEPFNGGAGNCINFNLSQIEIDADRKTVRGYIGDSITSIKDPFILDYVVHVKKASLSVYDPPLVFYVGLAGEMENTKEMSIRNGLLIRHELSVNESQMRFAMGRQLEKFIFWCTRKDIEEPSITTIKSFNEEVRCGHEGPNTISRIGEPMLPENINLSKISLREQYKVHDKSNMMHLISVQSDKYWSADQVLAGRGSTHNLYLDWFYYVGPFPFVLFVFFIFSLLGAFAHFTWKLRSSKEFPFVLSVFCQLLILTALMYGHPYLFLKYIWFVFGLATAIMIHPDLKGAGGGQFDIKPSPQIK
jgi:hypothetical protein